MVERLSRLEASFLYLEEPSTPMHVGGVLILDAPPGGVDALADLVQARLSLVPRYRQRVAEVPGHLANPVWVDDPDFDIAYHLRRNGLPRPGTEQQLLDLVSRLTSRPLDGAELVWQALDEYVRRPSAIVDTARDAVTDVRSTAARLTGVAGGLLRTARKTLLAAPHSPLNDPVGRQRRVSVARADLDDVKQIRKAHGGTVNDVLLTVVTGALREWLLSRGEPVVAGTSVRALVPGSIQDEEAP